MDDVGDAPLSVTHEAAPDGTTVVTVVGEIDLDTADVLRDAVAAARAHGAGHLVFRLDRVEFIDSSGLAALLENRDEQGIVRVVAPSMAVERLIVSTGLGAVIVTEP